MAWLEIGAVFVTVILSVVCLMLLCSFDKIRSTGYEYLLLNIAPGTSHEALLEHLRSNLKSKLNDDGFVLARTTALFSCSEKLGLDDWENCERFGGHWLVLVHKTSNKQVECADRFAGRIPNSTLVQARVKEINYKDGNRKPFQRVQLSGPFTELIVLLDRLQDSDQAFNRQDVTQMSFDIHDETKRPLIGRKNRADKHARQPDKHLDVVHVADVVPPPDIRPHCDSDKKELLDIEEDLYRYAMMHHKDEMERILHPKPLRSEFRSDVLTLVGQACLVSKAAEGVAVICQRLTANLSKVVFKLSEGINSEAFMREAESQVAIPSKTLLIPGRDNTFTLYGPKDKLIEVREGLKRLESQLRSPAVRMQAQPKSGSVTPHFQPEPRQLMTAFAEPVERRAFSSGPVEPRRAFSSGPVEPRRAFPSGPDYSAPNGSNAEPMQRSTFVKVEVNGELSQPGYQLRPNGETKNNALPIATEKLNKMKVSVLKGDLRKQTTNVIVNPANSQLLHRGGAAKAIAEAAGPRLVNECQDYIRRYGELKTVQVMHTTSGNLYPQIQYVIHAAGPSPGSYTVERDLERKLEETFFNCLKYANDKLQVKSISIPAISSGIYGAPKELVARAAYTAVKKFEQTVAGGAMTLEKVNFVNIDDESTDAFLEVFEGRRRSRKTSDDVDPVAAGSTDRGKPRSKSADQAKRKRVLLKKGSSSTFDQDGSANGLSNGTAAVANGDDSEDCVICMEAMISPKTLPCGHKFCEECIKDSFEKCQPKCPSCGRLFGVMRGNQPPGNMRFGASPQPLTGYERYKTILVEYDIPNGTQNDSHPNPGTPYAGTHRTAYLPDCIEGREVCELLRKAFDAGLVFTVGRSTTSGRDNQVIWNDIHHKTSETGTYGYPDPGYLSRVKEELKAKGIVSDVDDYKVKQTAI